VIFSPKNLAEKMSFLTQITANLGIKKVDRSQQWFSKRKMPFITSPKIVIVTLTPDSMSWQVRPEVVLVGVGAVPGLEAEPRVEVLVVEEDGDAAALVVHVVRLGVALDRHAGHVLLGRHPRNAKAPGITLKMRSRL
jgi:hypothetical protein